MGSTPITSATLRITDTRIIEISIIGIRISRIIKLVGRSTNSVEIRIIIEYNTVRLIRQATSMGIIPVTPNTIMICIT